MKTSNEMSMRPEVVHGGDIDLSGATAVLDSLPVAVIVLESDGTPCFANGPARRLAGVIHSDVEQGLLGLIAASPMAADPDGPKDCEDRFDCATEEGRTLGVVRQWRVAGEYGHVSVTLRPARNEEREDRAGALEGKSASEQQSLIHAEKLATVGQLAAGMAHEINNPICYVQSNLGTLRDYLNKLFGILELSDQLVRDGEMTPQQRLEALDMRKQAADYQMIAEDLPALLEESREGVERIRQIVQNLRDFSRLDPTESFRLFDVHRAIETTLDIVRSLGGGRIRFATYFQQLPLIECNPTELNQVLMNILVNATQAVDADGAIEIHTEASGDHVTLRISDNGSGMDAATQQRIFEPFFTTKEVGKGTGLGLSISYGIIQKHGGRIEVDSVVGQGTTFIITLPLRQANHTAEANT
ncbi:sensor histidine kinase [Oleiagrimonas soli]|uniref:histidine kinase n=1 Tax=Oleiagrimonas soli TaxID=1543381 RepID=A0A841KE83_9GAMM|nr:ATP-binding protein [Oleiagrimonas soli]MBB6183290.1 signal transduction histidine kinase [Oleiagrimonas soli]